MNERIDAHYDPEKGTITDANGVVRDVRFRLPDDVQKELDAKTCTRSVPSTPFPTVGPM